MMHQTKRGHIKNKSHVLERITLENMRRMLIASLAFVVLFFIEWVVMYFSRGEQAAATGYYVAMVAIPGVYLAFAGITFYKLTAKKRQATVLVRVFWAVTTVCSFISVFLIQNQFSLIMKVGVLGKIVIIIVAVVIALWIYDLCIRTWMKLRNREPVNTAKASTL